MNLRLFRALRKLGEMVPTKPNSISWERGVDIINHVQDEVVPAYNEMSATAPATLSDDNINGALRDLRTWRKGMPMNWYGNRDIDNAIATIESLQIMLVTMQRNNPWVYREVDKSYPNIGDEHVLILDSAFYPMSRIPWFASWDGTKFNVLYDNGRGATNQPRSFALDDVAAWCVKPRTPMIAPEVTS